MTELLFQENSYLQECTATVTALGDTFVVLDQTIFYPLGGGQPGDTGKLTWADGTLDIIDTRKGDAGAVNHVAAEAAALPPVGTEVTASIDWERRYKHMRMHTAMHLVGAIIPFGVTGGNISAAKSRLDFDTPEPIDKIAVTEKLAELVAMDSPVVCRWITDEELDAQPELVRTMSVQPPRGVGRIRLLDIRDIDLQPCGGTHLKQSGEVGPVRVSKVENKGKHNRRVNIVLDQ